MAKKNKINCTIAIGDAPCLRAENKEIESSWFDTEMLYSLVSNMIYTMMKVRGAGIAAPQIGINWKVAVAIVGRKPLALFNPQIVDHSDEQVSIDEGCLSVPDETVRIPRWNRIKVIYQTIKGVSKELEVTGIDAIVLQHEIDHLNGKLITDYKDVSVTA